MSRMPRGHQIKGSMFCKKNLGRDQEVSENMGNGPWAAWNLDLGVNRMGDGVEKGKRSWVSNWTGTKVNEVSFFFF